MRVSTSQLHQQSVKAILDQQANVGRTQLQLASGRRIQTPSQDPTGAKSVMDLGQAIRVTEQYQRNSDAGESRLQREETTLAQVVDIFQRARELAIQANSDSQGPDARKGIAAEIRELLESIKSLANTKDANGEYLFAGYQVSQQPFTDSGSGTYTYNGDQGQRSLQVGQDRRVVTGDSGDDVFMNIPGTSKDSFSILYDMAANLDSNSPNPSTIDDIDAAMNNFLNVRAKIGARLQAIDGQRGINDSQIFQLKQARSSIEDLDYAEAVTRFNNQMVGLEAAQKSYTRVQELSLFDYLR